MPKPPADGAAKIDAYLAGLAEPARATLTVMRQHLRAAAPKAATEAIHYGMPALHYLGPLIGYRAFAAHWSLFPMGRVEDLGLDLTGYEVSRGGIRFPIGQPAHVALVRKLVKACVARNEAK
ncbi:MAG: hypothetical protein FJW31_07965 [Acidobacteria bacterium]|nr:hypothetical protein [Acidobacteriota bacterium]